MPNEGVCVDNVLSFYQSYAVPLRIAKVFRGGHFFWGPENWPAAATQKESLHTDLPRRRADAVVSVQSAALAVRAFRGFRRIADAGQGAPSVSKRG
jgi:hypothetical protein